MNNKVDLRGISHTIWKNLLIILTMTIVFGIMAGLYANHKKHTVYMAERNIMTERSYNGSSANEELQADINLGKTFAQIIESKDVAKAAHKALPLSIRKKYSVKDINSIVDAHPIMQTTIIEVKVKANSARNASSITNAVVNASTDQIVRKVPSVTEIKPFAKVDANETQSTTSPSVKKYTLLGAAIGFLLGMVISFSITTWKKLV